MKTSSKKIRPKDVRVYLKPDGKFPVLSKKIIEGEYVLTQQNLLDNENKYLAKLEKQLKKQSGT